MKSDYYLQLIFDGKFEEAYSLSSEEMKKIVSYENLVEGGKIIQSFSDAFGKELILTSTRTDYNTKIGGNFVYRYKFKADTNKPTKVILEVYFLPTNPNKVAGIRYFVNQ